MTRIARRALPATAGLALLTLLTIPGLSGYLHCAIAAAVVGVLCVAVVAATPGGGRG
jgi:hypothetical protein